MTEELQNEAPKKFATFDAQGLPIGFYDSEIHKNMIPENAVEISDDVWAEFINNAGFRKFENGQIVEYVPPEPTDEEKWAVVKEKRDLLLSSSDWTQLADSPLTTSQKNSWKTYRQGLRDITSQENPDNISWPTKPE